MVGEAVGHAGLDVDALARAETDCAGIELERRRARENEEELTRASVDVAAFAVAWAEGRLGVE